MNRAQRRAHERRNRRRRDHHEPDANHGVMVGWCATEEDLPECRQRLHDNLIQSMGSGRTGGVAWRWWTGLKAEDALRHLRQGAVGERADHYRRIGALLREHGGYVVMASAKGEFPDGR